MIKPTLQQMAKRLGLSHASVSMALRNSPEIGEETRRRIQRHAQRVGYRPNRLAQRLKAKSTQVIGCVIPSLMMPNFARIVEDLYKETFRKGYQLQIMLSGSDIQQEARAIQECLDSRVDGLLILSSALDWKSLPASHPLREIRKTNFPCVMFHWEINKKQPVFSSVYCDSRHAFYLAARHLLQQGYRDLRLLTLGNKNFSSTALRIQGFRKALEESGKIWNPSWIITEKTQGGTLTSDAEDEGKIILQSYYDYSRNVEIGSVLAHRACLEIHNSMGLLCSNDQIALGAWSYCHQRGIRVPQEVGIVGCDNTVSPVLSITTYSWNYSLYAEKAITTLLSQIQKQKTPTIPVLNPIRGELIQRESTHKMDLLFKNQTKRFHEKNSNNH